METSQDPLEGMGNILFGKMSLEVVLAKQLLMKGFQQSPTVITKRIGDDFKAPRKLRLFDLQTAHPFPCLTGPTCESPPPN